MDRSRPGGTSAQGMPLQCAKLAKFGRCWGAHLHHASRNTFVLLDLFGQVRSRGDLAFVCRASAAWQAGPAAARQVVNQKCLAAKTHLDSSPDYGPFRHPKDPNMGL